MQATGAPDTPGCGDLPTSWTPTTPSADPEVLEVEYSTPVYATGAEVYETFFPGGVYLIEARDTGGTLHPVWSGIDTTTCEPPGSPVGVLNATWPETPYLVSAIRIHTAIFDYEEIDAVQLNGTVCE